jgi:hypothetical protein
MVNGGFTRVLGPKIFLLLVILGAVPSLLEGRRQCPKSQLPTDTFCHCLGLTLRGCLVPLWFLQVRLIVASFTRQDPTNTPWEVSFIATHPSPGMTLLRE